MDLNLSDSRFVPRMYNVCADWRRKRIFDCELERGRVARKRCGHRFLIISLKIDEGLMRAHRNRTQEISRYSNCVSQLFATASARIGVYLYHSFCVHINRCAKKFMPHTHREREAFIYYADKILEINF